MCDEMRRHESDLSEVFSHVLRFSVLCHVHRFVVVVVFSLEMLGNFLCYIITPPPLAVWTGAHSVHVSVRWGGFSAW